MRLRSLSLATAVLTTRRRGGSPGSPVISVELDPDPVGGDSGDVRRGFTLAKCDSCRESTLVAFSCKSRGWCPSCGARRAHETAAHLLEVLPEVAYRQWTLSLPFALRWPVVKEPKLLRAVERCLTRAIFRWQRKQAKAVAAPGKLRCGAVCFVQLFSSSLGLQPHLHLLVPEGVWSDGEFLELSPPSTQEVEQVLARMLAQARRTFEAMEAPWPEDAFEALQLQGAQERLNLGDEPVPRSAGRRVAVGEGFSLHADTRVHGNDRDGLARLCRYGARGPVAESRLSRRDDGKYAYETKKGGTLGLTAAQLVRRLLWLIPPARLHLTSFHGLLSSHAADRAAVLPRASPVPPAKLASAPTKKGRRRKLDWVSLPTGIGTTSTEITEDRGPPAPLMCGSERRREKVERPRRSEQQRAEAPRTC